MYAIRITPKFGGRVKLYPIEYSSKAYAMSALNKMKTEFNDYEIVTIV